MTIPVILCADALRPVSLTCLTRSVELLEERVTEILRLANTPPSAEASFRVGTAAARAEVNIDQIRRHLLELGLALPETVEPDVEAGPS